MTMTSASGVTTRSTGAEGVLEFDEHLARTDGQAPCEAVLIAEARELIGVLGGVDVDRHHQDVSSEAGERRLHNQLLCEAVASPDRHAFDDHDLATGPAEREAFAGANVGELHREK